MSATVSAEAFVSIRYSVWPIFAVPVGSTRFCALTALTMSAGVARLQRLRIEVDRDHARAAAVRERDLHARHRDQLRAQEVERDVGERLFAERLARQPELDHRDARRRIGDHERRRRALRHLPHDRLRGRDRLRDRRLHVRARLQEHLHDRDAGQRRRFDVLDVVDGRRQDPLMHRRDAVRHLGRGEAAVIPDDADHGNVDRGQHVDRRAHQRKRVASTIMMAITMNV